MKIDKKRLVEIIKEEMEMMSKHHDRGEHMHHVDKEGKFVMNQLKHIAEYAMELHQMLEPYGENIQLESWVQMKMTLAKDYISKVKHYLEHELNFAPAPGMEE